MSEKKWNPKGWHPKITYDVEVYENYGGNEWAQAKYLVHGDDVMWTNKIEDVLHFLKIDLKALEKRDNTKETRGCNLCQASASASKKGLLEEDIDCMVCGTSYKASKRQKEGEE